MPSWTIFVFIGITGGLAAGIFGIGGSLIIVPACNKSKPIKPLSFLGFYMVRTRSNHRYHGMRSTTDRTPPSVDVVGLLNAARSVRVSGFSITEISA